MSARLREIAKRTEEIVGAGRYEAGDGRPVSIGAQVAAALAGTRMYGPEPVAVTPDTGRTTRFEVTGESSLEAAHRLVRAAPGEVAVLNFSSARNPGGGYLNGAQAQEEALCRASALYATLLRVPEFYAHHRADRSPFYTDRVIHSPGVPVFRDDRGRLLNSPYTVGFLTSPAPNAGVIARRTPGEAGRVPAALASRAERVLQTAVACGYRRLVLGAWGCGVFQNDPAQVAGAFRALLTGEGPFAGHFDEVVFAVLDRTSGARTLGAFRDAFAAVTTA
ncbi:TIGR02452 family protein [Streptomyces sp. WAC05374]|uniref:TIGR02452 family protein n=1 Tax=Streptomyces sp. WAC05374 TaxID=2487420 RepID=UPI000F88FF03|nr:TIGR02452 family protein [Streptomyces sp. WAC05374]RST17713.1 TIGR02452 family protein [Streptomyces sp. WAC05374]TDF52714.1 TIGR02452 family protein [Streptomyces sp. WAC05374]TDF54133.1 TIGR02452 family protein [Streptomyces sp. WAC05374]